MDIAETLSVTIASKKVERELFAALWKAVQNGQFDEAYTKHLDAFITCSENKAASNFFLAHLSLHYGETNTAYELARKAYGYRKASPAIWRLLVACAAAAGCPDEAAGFRVMLALHAGEQMGATEFLALHKTAPAYALPAGEPPFHHRFDGRSQTDESLVNQFLPIGEESRRYFCAMYNSDAVLSSRAARAEVLNNVPWMDVLGMSNILFEVGKASAPTIHFSHRENGPFILPIAGNSDDRTNIMGQRIELDNGKRRVSLSIGKAEWRFIRMEEATHITSDAPFVCGRPIHLSHSPKRRKLVLALFLDGLSWPAMRDYGYRHVPHIMRFFQKGVIFSHAYSPAEYTFPSAAAIESSLHLHRSQVFHPKVYAPLDKKHLTLSEQMDALGYYCVSVSGDGRGIYSEATRGFDRLICCPLLAQPAAEAVQRAIDHLDAFSETDNYLSVHVSDPHQFPAKTAPLARKTQTSLRWQDGTFSEEGSDKTVWLENAHLYHQDNTYHIARMDAEIGRLLRYVEEHYAEDEYIVYAYSDHGSAIYTSDRWLLSEMQSGSAMMLRGAGVPPKGFVDELASQMDLYPILGKLAGFPVPSDLDGNLPAVFGGMRRSQVISTSIFPGQTYKLAIRTDAYEARFETKASTRMDGTIDVIGASIRVFTRGASPQEVTDPSIQEYFMQLALRHTASFDEPEVGQCSITP